MKLFCFILGLVLVICTFWESGLAQIVCDDLGGFVLINDDYSDIFSAPVTTGAVKKDLMINSLNGGDFESIGFHQATSTLLFSENGPTATPAAPSQSILYRNPIDTCYEDQPVPFLDVSTHLHTTTTMNIDITAMTIDETNNRLYWVERYSDITGTSFAIWTVSLDSDNANQDKIILYEFLTVVTSGNAFIDDIEVDPTTQQLYWVLVHGSPTQTSVTYQAWADGSGIIASREDPVNTIVGIELDVANGYIYWQHETDCQIHRLSIDEFLSGSPTQLYSSTLCTAVGFFLSLAEESFYFLNDDDALIQVSLTGASETTVVSDLGINIFTGMIFVPNCPITVPEISLTATEYTTYEGDAQFAVEVQQLGAPCYDPQVRVINFGGTASRPSDYSFLIDGQPESLDSQTIQFQNFKRFFPVYFEIYNDERTEGNETFIIELADPSPYASVALGEITKAEVTIIDKTSYFQFTDSKFEVTEGEPTLTIPIERIGSLENAAVVSLRTTPGTAAASGDYNPTIADVSFNAFQSEAAAVININDDDELEMDETFQISFVDFQSVGQSTAEVLIKENEIGYSFQQTGYEFNEDVGQIIIPVERIGSTEVDGSVDMTFSNFSEDHTAMVGEDFSQFNPTTLKFAPGQSIANIYVFITNDNQYESTESFQIALSKPRPHGSDFITDVTTVSILDDEENIRFVENQATAWEGRTTTLRFPITRDVALKETSVLITSCEPYRSAVGGEDFVPVNSAIVRFSVGEMITYTPDIIILDDNHGEVYESFRLVITSPEQGAIACNEDMTNDIYIGIIDDDGATYRFSSSNYVIPEYSANLKVRINQEGIRPDNDQERVTLSAISGSATNNRDFVFNGPRQLNFGDTGYTDVLIQIVSDNEYELGGESFTLELTNDAGDILDTATVTIQDDDRPATPPQPQSYYFKENSITVSESSEDIRVVVHRTDRSTRATVLIDTVPGSATPRDDYFPLNRYPLEFGVGDLVAERVIYIVDDGDNEDMETFQVVLSSPTDGGSVTGGPLTVTITDDDDISDNSLSTAALIGIIAAISGGLFILALLMVICCIALFRRASNGLRTPTVVPPVQFNKQYGQQIPY